MLMQKTSEEGLSRTECLIVAQATEKQSRIRRENKQLGGQSVVRSHDEWVMEKMAHEKMTWQAWENFSH